MKYFIVIFCFLLSGCMSVSYENGRSPLDAIRQRKPLTSADATRLNMTEGDVKAVMGSQLVSGYQHSNGSIEPITVNQPHRVENIMVDGIEYQVAFYITKIRIPDDMIAEDELTPFVFKDGKLISKDMDFLFRLKNGQIF